MGNSANEQDFSEDIDAMLACWEVSDGTARQNLIRNVTEDMAKRDHYDGKANARELRLNMKPIDDIQIYLRHVKECPEGKKICGTNTIIYDIVSFVVGDAKPFESTIRAGKPAKVSLEEGPIVPGLMLAMVHMREGEQAYVLVHPSQAYGRLGCPPMIPPDAYLYYYVKILKVLEESTLNRAIQYELDNRVMIPWEEKVSLIEEHKRIANDYWRDEQPKEALIRYKAAIKVLEELETSLIMSNSNMRTKMVDLLLNATIALNKLSNHKSATKYAKKALQFDPDNLKIYYHLAKARIGLADYLTALCWIERAQRKDPKNRSFDHLKIQLEPYFRHYNQSELLRKMASCAANM